MFSKCTTTTKAFLLTPVACPICFALQSYFVGQSQRGFGRRELRLTLASRNPRRKCRERNMRICFAIQSTHQFISFEAIMTPNTPWQHRFRALLRGDPQTVVDWIDDRGACGLVRCIGVIVAGCGLYGASVGLWRSPLQAAFVAVKMPLVILLTAAGNAVLNGVLAQLLGTGLSFRQTSQAIVMSFAVAAIILASLSPLVLFLQVNTPPFSSDGHGGDVMLVALVAAIAFAGIVANVRLLGFIEHASRARTAALQTLFAWLAGNLLLGSQIAWVLRPYIGPADLPVEFFAPSRGEATFSKGSPAPCCGF